MKRSVQGILVALLLQAVPVFAATDVGIFQRANCAELSPVTGKTFCFDETANRLKRWNGSAWEAIDAGATLSVPLPSFTKAGLPIAGTAGRLSHVTDGVRGIWMDQGSQWFPLTGGVVNVMEFGAKGDGKSDDSTAIQAAINSASTHTTVFFPAGIYYVPSAISLKSYLRYVGVGGYNGSVLMSGDSNSIFTWANGSRLEFIEIAGLAFTGRGTAIKSTGTYDYLSTAHIHHNHFLATIAEGIHANLILCNIEHNTFGYFGAAGLSSRHIYSKGDVTGNATNANRIASNQFYNAKGGESVYLEAGYQVTFIGNDFEQNRVTATLNIRGLYHVTILDNWFEANDGISQVYMDNDGSGTIGNYVVRTEGNFFNLNGSGNAHIFYLGPASGNLRFIGNSGTNMLGKHVSRTSSGSNDRGISTYEDNFFIGYSHPRVP